MGHKSNKNHKHDHQFRETSNHGEHRNGRLSQFKNSTSGEDDHYNQYVSSKDND
ncbi:MULTISPECIES: hypothetical protein [Geomicrobium]|uniref:Uncharacterized protein n=1 Tax=Geomicrobium sediminis TaxID=1347788 RepID=A0ABS2PIS4_9BACL|nr:MULTISPECIES: hypothetical protein [Geomicrobium]MBM7634723.1 hypothetical protein [Geomicrobium sediminis]